MITASSVSSRDGFLGVGAGDGGVGVVSGDGGGGESGSSCLPRPLERKKGKKKPVSFSKIVNVIKCLITVRPEERHQFRTGNFSSSLTSVSDCLKYTWRPCHCLV